MNMSTWAPSRPTGSPRLSAASGRAWAWLGACLAFFLLWPGTPAAQERAGKPLEVEGPTTKAAAARGPEVSTTVYVTRTGEKYHRDGCRYLARSRRPIGLPEAAATYGACSVCRPPVLSSPSAPRAAAKAESSAPPWTSSQCQATTKKGTQCSRKAQSGRAFCWQH